MGSIYKIVNTVNDKVYVGQTTLKLSERWNKHKTTARQYARDPNSFPRGTCTKLYNATTKHGLENFSMELIDTATTKEDLDSFEELFIIVYDSIDNGYNLKSGGDSSKHAEETKVLISERTRAGINGSTINNFRKNMLSMGLPKHIVYVNGPRTGEGYRLHRHPLCKGYPTFTFKRYGSWQAALRAIDAYLAELQQNQ